MADQGNEAFGTVLRRQRRAAGLTQEELAARAGLSARGIADLERGARHTPRRDTVELLAQALGGSPEVKATLFAALAAARRTASPTNGSGGTADGVASDVPPTQVHAQPRHNLPAQVSSLLGRDDAIRAVVALARRAEVRLVTLTGPGGVGKTRLAIAVAAGLLDDYTDGVWFVRLSRLTDPALVLPTVAATLGLKEAGDKTIADMLRDHLRERRLLLVLDNCEHVVTAMPEMASLLESCPALNVLATSRAALRLVGEHEYPVPPLGLPPTTTGPDSTHAPERLTDYPATALFVERARAAQPAFALTAANTLAVAAICARLDGLPLAIELAAARVKLLPPPALSAQLERGLSLLSGGARDLAARQQAIRSTIAWSENLLSAEERMLFRRLSVFAGGCTLAAARAVCAAPAGTDPLRTDLLDGLGALVDHSLVHQREEDGEPRFGMLHVVREYALTRLQTSGEAETLRRDHAVHMAALAERAEPELSGPEQGAWLNRLERERDNLRAALAWATERSEAETGLRLVGALGRFWLARGHLREGRAWAEGLLRLVATPAVGSTSSGTAGTIGGVPAQVRAGALIAGGSLAFRQEDSVAAVRWLEEGAALARAAGDPRATITALSALGLLAHMRGGDWERAVVYFEESLELSRKLGDQWRIAVALGNLGDTLARLGHLERAAETFSEALARARQAGDPGAIHICLLNLGWVMRLRGEPAQAEALQREGLKLAGDLNDPRRCAEALEMLAATSGALGQGERAARLLGAAVAARETIGAPQPAEDLADLEQAVAGARAALGEQRWAAAFAAGRSRTLDEAAAEALTPEA